MRKKLFHNTKTVLLFLVLLVFLIPVWNVLAGSFMSDSELAGHTGALLSAGEGVYADWTFLPLQPSGWSYLRLLLDTPEYFVTFWNSVLVTAISVVAQAVVAVLAAWGIGVYRFRYRKHLLGLYVFLMMLPFQVLMLPQYFIMKNLHIYDTFWALIIPEIFSPYAVFLLVQNFKTLQQEVLESARIDGAGEWTILFRIGLPHAKAGIITVMLLGFVECWGMIEQPGAFIEDKGKMLVSEYLPHIDISQPGFALAASALALIPCVLLVLICSDYMEKGLEIRQ